MTSRSPIIDQPQTEEFKHSVRDSVAIALTEDIGSGDVTAQLIDSRTQASATIITRESATLCGSPWLEEAFRQCDRSARFRWFAEEGDTVEGNTKLVQIEGSARALLSAERTALNFLQTLSGTATLSTRYSALVAHTSVKVLDTRKTIPGLRLAQKYAVRCGGCHNHRSGLYDAFLIKENHILAAGSIQNAVVAARMLAPELIVEVEVENYNELITALDAEADTILLDNFSLTDLRKAVLHTAGAAKLEASGNIDMTNIARIAETGVDYISVGELTKKVIPIDLSMRFSAT